MTRRSFAAGFCYASRPSRGISPRRSLAPLYLPPSLCQGSASTSPTRWQGRPRP